MWYRCPECDNWCSAEKKGLFGRMFRSLKKGDKDLGESFGNLGDAFGMKGLGKTAGRFVNVLNGYKHCGEMLNGDKYLFYCSRCGNEFGTNDESKDMTEEHYLYMKTKELANRFSLTKDQTPQYKKVYTKEVQDILAKIENSYGIDDAKATMHDILACCYYFFFNDSENALLEINKSLALFDDEKSHVLKGLFMGNVISPESNYDKMRELLKINECDSEIIYVDRATILGELEQAKRSYEQNFTSIPNNQRKFLVVTSEYTYLPNSFKILKYNDTDLSGVIFENGVPNNNAIYICHPYKPNVYLSSETYQTSLFKNQLNEFRELLQCLGAKSIKTENSLSTKRSSDEIDNLNGKIEGGYKGVSGNVSGEQNSSSSLMQSMIQRMLIDDEFSLNSNTPPYIPDDLVWFEHMEEWQRLARMRLRGQNKYSISISTRQINIVNANEANTINAEFKALIARGNFEISQSTELKVSEENSHEWNLVVEFYSLSEYDKEQKHKDQVTLKEFQKDTPAIDKKSRLIQLLLVVVIILLALTVGILLFKQ